MSAGSDGADFAKLAKAIADPAARLSTESTPIASAARHGPKPGHAQDPEMAELAEEECPA